MNHVGSKTRSLGQFKKNNIKLYTLEGRVLIQSSWNCSGMCISMTLGPPWARETDVLLNDLGHMTRRAATPIYVSTFYDRNTGLFGRL